MSGNCNGPSSGRLLSRYELGLVSEDEAERFEAHVLGCTSCYRQLVEGILLVTKLRSLIEREPRPAPPERRGSVIPIEVVCSECEARGVYRPVEYVGQFLICRSCRGLVPVGEFYPQCTPEAQLEMWHDPSMRPYLRNSDFPDLRK